MTDDEEGLTAWQLLYKLWGGSIPDEATLRLQMMPHEEYEERVLRRVYTVLRKDLYVGWGFLPGADERKEIPASYWGRLEIHPPSNIAAGGGFEFYDLRFFEAKDGGEKEEAPSAPRRPVSKPKLKAFMEKRLVTLRAEGKQSNQREDETAAREHFKGCSITREWISQIRDELNVPPEWSKRGRRPKN